MLLLKFETWLWKFNTTTEQKTEKHVILPLFCENKSQSIVSTHKLR